MRQTLIFAFPKKNKFIFVAWRMDYDNFTKIFETFFLSMMLYRASFHVYSIFFGRLIIEFDQHKFLFTGTEININKIGLSILLSLNCVISFLDIESTSTIISVINLYA